MIIPGTRVRKCVGYHFEGKVLGTFTKLDGVTLFVNVEDDFGWVMHFRERELVLVTPGQERRMRTPGTVELGPEHLFDKHESGSRFCRICKSEVTPADHKFAGIYDHHARCPAMGIRP